ncbi:galactosylceramide sulfotransferase-like isoform X2 [Convolutriloba macropyga]|uniref:galactosylceramide sulfotransferase-like isoform X2 n=1 Tax=Convolutriloba macropyga TaxID=536237 RepID=UPI003F528B17
MEVSNLTQLALKLFCWSYNIMNGLCRFLAKRCGFLTKLALIVFLVVNFSIFLIQHWLDSSERHSDFEQLLVHPQKSAKKIVFVKTHKTASTTIQSILCRHALYNKLKVAVPKNGKNFFSYLEKPFIATQSKTQNPDVILFHMNFLQSEVEKLIPKNSESVFLTILRDIPDAFESRITYYKFKDKSNALPEIEDAKQLTAQVVNRYDAILRKINGTGTYHQQLRIILGNWYFYQFNQRSKESQKALNMTENEVEATIRFMEDTFDIVMITERFDESLILLKEHLGISTEQITYISLYERYRKEHYNKQFDQDVESAIRKKLWADDTIYKHFRTLFDQKVEQFGEERMRIELSELKQRQDELHDECIDKEVVARQSNAEIFVPRKVAMMSWKLKKKAPAFCRFYTLSEREWLNKFR